MTAGRPEVLESPDASRVHGTWLRLVLAVAIGAVAGYAAATWLSGYRSPEHGPPGNDVRLSLAVDAGRLIPARADDPFAAVDVPLVTRNDGPDAVEIIGVLAAGPGALLLDPLPGRATVPFPLVVSAGAESELRIVLGSDCRIPVRPLPTVSIDVAAGESGRRAVVAPVPGLASVWGRTLDPAACRPWAVAHGAAR